MKLLGSQTFWGITAFVMIAAAAIAATVMYVAPPGARIVAFYTTDAAAIRPGESVRIAGITVGKVKGISIEPNRVKVQAMVEKGAFVGDQSQIQVRMLTIVGGYYVNLVSLGDDALGDKVIPADRVTMPYNLIRALNDASDVAQRVDPKPIKESLDQVQGGLTGTNIATLSAIIDAGNAITGTIEAQRGQISQILGISDEYIRELSQFRGGLQDLVSKLAILEQTLVIYGKGTGRAMSGMGDIGDAIHEPLSKFWVNHREEFIQKVAEWQDRFRRWADNNSRIIPRLRRVRDKIERVLDAQNARPELLATDLCIPMPGSLC